MHFVIWLKRHKLIYLKLNFFYPLRAIDRVTLGKCETNFDINQKVNWYDVSSTFFLPENPYQAP